MTFLKERVQGQESLLKVAAVQFEPQIGNLAGNKEKLISLIKQAFKEEAKLIVTPECGNGGYIFNNRSEAFECAEHVPDGPMIKELEKIARNQNGYIVCGIIEKEENLLYNTAALIGPKGFIGKYRKNHLWDVDKILYEPGNLGFPVFDLPFGKVGISICYDAWFPEVSRIYAAQGVDILCHPTAWVVVPGLAEPKNPLWAYNAMTQAHHNSMFMVCADRIGTERGITFAGCSCICGLPGFIEGPISHDKEEILFAEINVTDARRKRLGEWNHLLRDRRTDLYDNLLGYNDNQSRS